MQTDKQRENRQVLVRRIKNPRRVAAGRLNRAKRRGLTPAGRERLRESALKHRPWENSTGPKTAAGKAKSARNRIRKPGIRSLVKAIRKMKRISRTPIPGLRRIVAMMVSQALQAR